MTKIEIQIEPVCGMHRIRALSDDSDAELFAKRVAELENQGLSVEWLSTSGETKILITQVGEKIGISRGKHVMYQLLQGAGLDAETEVLQQLPPAHGTTLAGRLVPDVLAYVPPSDGGDPDAAFANHADLVVEIDWIDAMEVALDKVALYFDKAYVGPNGTLIREVWLLLLPRRAPTLPVGDSHPAVQLNTMAFIEPGELAAASNGDGAILAFFSRYGAFLPTFTLLPWNATIAVPAGSLYNGPVLPADNILTAVYRTGPVGML